MNEDLNLVELLKDVPVGTEFYCALMGTVVFDGFWDSCYPIMVHSKATGLKTALTAGGALYSREHGECVLFPSKDQRDWAVWKEQQKTKDVVRVTLHPFDRVLGRDDEDEVWRVDFFSYYKAGGRWPFYCIGDYYKECIPYNRDTAHLYGTTADCPTTYNMSFSRVCDD